MEFIVYYCPYDVRSLENQAIAIQNLFGQFARPVRGLSKSPMVMSY